jgi:hypothetical protein
MTVSRPKQEGWLVNVPVDLHSKLMDYLFARDLQCLRATCNQFLTAISWKDIAQSAIKNNLNQYIDQACYWCDRAIDLIQENYKSTAVDHREITKLVVTLGIKPSHSQFLPILTALKCHEQLEPHAQGPCICEVD